MYSDKTSFSLLCSPSCIAVRKANTHFPEHSYEWVRLFLEDREGRVQGLQGKKSDAAHFFVSEERAGYKSRVFAAQPQSHTDAFRRWVRRQRVGRAGEWVLFSGEAAHGSSGAGTPKGARGLQTTAQGQPEPCPGLVLLLRPGSARRAQLPAPSAGSCCLTSTLPRACLGVSGQGLELSWVGLLQPSWKSQPPRSLGSFPSCARG